MPANSGAASGKAALVPVEGKAKKVAFHFNPDKISYSKSITLTPKTQARRNVPEQDYSGGIAGSIELGEVLFDATLPRDKQSRKLKVGQQKKADVDIRQVTDQLLALMDIDEDIKPEARPPMCRFQWGSFESFKVFVKSVSLTFELFTPDGIPLRARASITLEQAEDDSNLSPQNPTSRSYARKMWTVLEGETLDWIAYQEYGDSAAWRHIAEANNLANPLALRPGQLLKLTPLE